jgi:hypothetical protein
MSKEIDRDREERRLCKKYNILFRGPAHPWPKDHSRAFQHVSVLGKYLSSDYVAQNGGLEAGEKRWKSSTIGRTKTSSGDCVKTSRHTAIRVEVEA